ncbi:exosporium protein ExsE [Bacillus wiedmannii]|uniref:exosporium protein ExsE n=1 Tax=Bacillus wiedmannii TaxID=1890302 RepID=UPI000BF1A8FA|nr:exosporium protein ExsE [Bacillus wiedmannii]PEL91625.1 exosporium protein E [Bacillus wiedmannii]PRT23135.1 exosporium protein E [Bacillus wiedmannii]
MRTWRVGTFSMGLSIISLGCFLLFSVVKGTEVLDSLTAWWPVLLIILGVEILLYLLFSKKEQSFIKYDIFSIFFIGILGSVGIAFYCLLSTGLLDEVRHSIHTTRQTSNIPSGQIDIPESIKKIVVDAGQHPLTIEGNDTKQIHLLGTYEMTTKTNEKLNLKQEDFLSVQTAGETMYITLKSLPVQHTLWNSAPQVKPTLVLPQNKNVEVRASNNDLSLYPGQLQNNWFVQESSNVSVHLAKESDVSLIAITNKKESHGNTPWEQVEDLTKKEENTSEENKEFNEQEHWYKNSIKTGNGTYKLNIEKAYNINMSIIEK